jgi:hypothetical protein
MYRQTYHQKSHSRVDVLLMMRIKKKKKEMRKGKTSIRKNTEINK